MKKKIIPGDRFIFDDIIWIVLESNDASNSWAKAEDPREDTGWWLYSNSNIRERLIK